jgi:hypothetical protein
MKCDGCVCVELGSGVVDCVEWSVMGVCRDEVGVGCLWSGVRWM